MAEKALFSLVCLCRTMCGLHCSGSTFLELKYGPYYLYNVDSELRIGYKYNKFKNQIHQSQATNRLCGHSYKPLIDTAYKWPLLTKGFFSHAEGLSINQFKNCFVLLFCAVKTICQYPYSSNGIIADSRTIDAIKTVQ